MPPDHTNPANADDAFDDLLWIQATRVVAGQLPDAEEAELRHWLLQHEDGAVALAEAERVWQAVTDAPFGGPAHEVAPAWDVEAAMARLARAREAAPSTIAPRGGVRSQPQPTRRWWPAAAAAVLVVGALTVWKSAAPPTGDHVDASPTQLALAVPAGAAPREMELADGSRVLLAPGSTVRSRGTFGRTARELELTGEARFTVANGDAPFVVHAAGVRIEDVSTAFVVRALPRAALVAVTDGEVRVGAARTALRMGTAVIADVAGALDTLSAEAARSSVAWTNGGLAFSHERVDAVMERLQRWTGRDLAVDPALASRRISVTFERESPRRMIEIVAQTLGARVEERGATWTLRTAETP